MAELPVTWRVRPTGRVFGVAVTAGMRAATIASVIALARIKGGIADLVRGLVVFPALALLAWRPTMSSWLKLTSGELIVQNPIGLTRIPLRDIVDVSAGKGGVVIKRIGQSVVVAWAVQKAPLAARLRWRTRADDVVEAIQKAAREAGGADTSPAPAPCAYLEELRREFRRYPEDFHPRHGKD